MADIARRFETNPILRPSDVKPSRDGMQIECLLNPGVFRFDGKTWLLIRVAERPAQPEGKISTPVLDPLEPTGIKIVEIALDDPGLKTGDPRVFNYKGDTYLTTLSHLRLARSDDGIHFQADERPTLTGAGELETFGIEDCRVTEIDGVFYLTYTAVSRNGVAVGMMSTSDWKTFHRHGVIFPPSNKDSAIFPEKIGGHYYALHRPSNVYIGGHYIWLAHSPDLFNWGGHVASPGRVRAAGIRRASARGPRPSARSAAGWRSITGRMRISVTASARSLGLRQSRACAGALGRPDHGADRRV